MLGFCCRFRRFRCCSCLLSLLLLTTQSASEAARVHLQGQNAEKETLLQSQSSHNQKGRIRMHRVLAHVYACLFVPAKRLCILGGTCVLFCAWTLRHVCICVCVPSCVSGRCCCICVFARSFRVPLFFLSDTIRTYRSMFLTAYCTVLRCDFVLRRKFGLPPSQHVYAQSAMIICV